MRVCRRRVRTRGTSRKPQRLINATVIAGVLGATALAGCGSASNSGSASSSAAAQTSASAGAQTSASSGASSNAAAVPIMLIAPLTGSNGVYVPWVNAVKGTVAQINATGSAGGHHLNLTVCDAGETANTEQACGAQAVQQKDAAVITMDSEVGPIARFTDRAGIPRFGFMVDPLDFTDKLSYDTADAGGSTQQGMVALAKSLTCKTMSIVRADPGSASEVAAYQKNFLGEAKAIGLQATWVEVPPGTPQANAYVSKGLANHPDCLLIEGFGADEISLMKAAGQLAPASTHLLTAPSFISPEAVKSLGSLLNRVRAPNFAWPLSSQAQHPSLATFTSTMKKYDPEPYQLDNNSEDMWSETNALAYAIGHVSGAVTAASVVASLNKMTNYDTGIGPPVSFSQNPTAPVKARVFAPYTIGEKYVGGNPIAVGGFFNEYTGKPVG